MDLGDKWCFKYRLGWMHCVWWYIWWCAIEDITAVICGLPRPRPLHPCISLSSQSLTPRNMSLPPCLSPAHGIIPLPFYLITHPLPTPVTAIMHVISLALWLICEYRISLSLINQLIIHNMFFLSLHALIQKKSTQAVKLTYIKYMPNLLARGQFWL